MGVDTHINVGPYLVVKGKKTEMLDKKVRTCTNKKCIVHKNNQEYPTTQKFCADCGSEVDIKEYKEKWTCGPDSLISDEPYDDEFCDELCCTDGFDNEYENTFVPNESSPYDEKRGRLEEGDVGTIDLTDVEIQKEIKWFEKRYKKIIDVYKKEFGEDSCSVKWGVIQWYS